MSKLNKELTNTLEVLVKDGKIDGLGPSAVQDAYAKQLGHIKQKAFISKLLRIRKKLGKIAQRKDRPKEIFSKLILY